MNKNNIDTWIVKDFILSPPSLIQITVVNNGRTLMCPIGKETDLRFSLHTEVNY